MHVSPPFQVVETRYMGPKKPTREKASAKADCESMSCIFHFACHARKQRDCANRVNGTEDAERIGLRYVR